MTLPFRYKLTAIVIALIISLFASSFYLIQTELEARFTLEIQKDLEQTKPTIRALMKSRYQSFSRQAKALASDLLIREILTDHSLDQSTRFDILNSEIYPAYSGLDLIIVLDDKKTVLANTPNIQESLQKIQNHNTMKRLLQGKKAPFIVFQKNHYYQLVGHPVVIGNKLSGLIIVGQQLSSMVADKIKSVSGADLVFFKQDNIVLTTQWSTAGQALSHQSLEQKIATHTKFIVINGERFISQRVPASPFVPAYLLAKSLDLQLQFVKKMREQIIFVALIGLLIGSIIAFVFSRSISKPIQQLQKATYEIERENFNHHVNIQTRDEFKQLSTAFNQMIKGLKERETLHHAMNQTVSKIVTDAVLGGQVDALGQSAETTLLRIGITNEATWLPGNISTHEQLALFNELLTRIKYAIESHQGFINQFSTDNTLAAFGNPIADNKSQEHAIKSALLTQEAITQFNTEAPQPLPVEVLTLLHHNTAINGQIGPSNQHQFSIIGTAVNETNSLYPFAKVYQAATVVSHQLEHFVPGHLAKTRILDALQLPPLKTHITLYELMPISSLSAAENALLTYQKAHTAFHNQDWDKASALFKVLLEINPADHCCQSWLKRTQYFKEHTVYSHYYQQQHLHSPLPITQVG